MKQQIINILEKYTNQIDIQGYGELNLVNEDEFYKIAEEIEKLYNRNYFDLDKLNKRIEDIKNLHKGY